MTNASEGAARYPAREASHVASLLLHEGDSVVYVKEQLGHRSVQITVDTYGNPIRGANRAAVDR